MAESKLMFHKYLNLIIAIIWILNQIGNSIGSDNYTAPCPPLTSSTSTNVRCEYKGNILKNCANPIDGTTVIISCNSFYEETSLSEYSNQILCINGKWNAPIPQCNPICGRVPLEASRKFNRNSPHNYPWHVGIYKNTKAYVCGGSIINPKIILTAAHCIADNVGNVYPSENYLVAGGKFYRNYDDIRDPYAQYSQISEIHVPERYKGVTGYFSSDIAILILRKPFVLSVAVQPVCVESKELSENLKILLNQYSIGVVIGWGYTQPSGPLSETLKELMIPYIPFGQCFQEVPLSFRGYISIDKFCGGYLNNGTGVCTGDGGGGIIFKNLYNGRYYIKGITNISPSTPEFQCDINQYALYTLVSSHIEFVYSLMSL